MQPLKNDQRPLLKSSQASSKNSNGSIYNRTNSNIFSYDEDEDEDGEDDDSDNYDEQMQRRNLELNNNTNYTNSNNIKTKILNNLPKKYNRKNFTVQHVFKKLRCFVFTIPIIILLMFYLQINTNISTRHVQIPDWGYNTSRNLADYVLPDNDTTLIEPKRICDSKVFLMIIVCSSVQNFAARQIIRETWGNLTEFNYSMFPLLHEHLKGQYLLPTKSRIQYYKKYFESTTNRDKINYITHLPLETLPATTTTKPSANIFNKIVPKIKILFLIGRNKDEAMMGNETITRIHNEALQYNDIIQENFIDSYNNLTIKTMFTLKWFKKSCSKQVAFLMKCDDDTFVNIPNLIHYLLGGTVPLYNDTFHFYDINTFQPLAAKNRLTATSNFLVGHLFCTSRPIGDVNSKWYMPDYIYPEETYPKYLSGAGYIMTSDVVQKLYETALNTTLIHLEDVYLTGIVAAKAGIQPHHHPLFDYTRSKFWCSFKGILTQHDMKDDSLLEAYYFVLNTTHHCPPPGRYFKRMRLSKPHPC